MTREPIRTKSIHIPKLYHILFYYLKKLLYQLYYTILQYSQHPFYFLIQYIKIIYLYNKISLSLSLSHHLHHHCEDPKPQHSLSKKKKTQHKNSSQTPSKPIATPISPLQQLLDHWPSLQAAAAATIAIPYFYSRHLYSSQTHLFSPTLPHHHIHWNPIPNKPSKHRKPPSNPSTNPPTHRKKSQPPNLNPATQIRPKR